VHKESQLKYSRAKSAELEKALKKRRLRKQWQLTKCPYIKTRLNRIIKDLKKVLAVERNWGYRYTCKN